MSLSTPILKSPITPFSAGVAYNFEFNYLAGNQVVKNRLEIQKTSNNSVVYDKIQDTFSLKHTVIGNTLQNGIEYKCRIRVADINNNWSNYSDWVVFWVLSKATVTINNIDYANQNRVYNQTINFESAYSQPEGELLQSYRYLLYDTNKNLIFSFPEQFADGSKPLIQEITNLENGVTYYLEIKTISANGALNTSGLINFKPFYIQPRLSAILDVENLKKQGAIKVSANILQILGKLFDSNGIEIDSLNIDFLDNDWIDLTRSDYNNLVFDEGFNILQSDFIMMIWCKNIINNNVFLRLTSEYGKIELIKYNDRMHAFKYLNENSIVPHFASNELIINQDEIFMIKVKQINHSIDLQLIKVI